MRDQFNFSGDFRGAVVNVGSTLEIATARVRTGRHDLPDAEGLIDLLDSLRNQLAQVPSREADAAAEVASATDELIAYSVSPKQDKARLRSLGAALRAAADVVGRSGPGVVTTIARIIELIGG